MLGFYNYTVIATYIGMLSSVVGIIYAMNGYPGYSIICLMFSGLCDMYDGKIARTRTKSNEQEKKFGIQIDSLSDLICFGVLPGIIGYNIGMNRWYFIIVIGVYILAALIRLAYFNVMEEERQSQTEEHRKTYSGLPVTTVALIFPLLFCFKQYVGSTVFPYLYAGFMLLISVLFLLNFTIRKPQKKGMVIMLVFGCLEFLVFLLFRFVLR